MSGLTFPYGPGMGPTPYSLPPQIDPVTGVPIQPPQTPPQAPPAPALAAPPPAPLQMSMPPASLPFSGPQIGPGDMAPPAAAPPAAPADPQPAPQAPASQSAPQAAPTPQAQPDQMGDNLPAGDRYLHLLPSIFQSESGGRVDAKNSKSSASGLGQITDDTFRDFINSPSNVNKFTMADKNSPKAQQVAGQWNLARNDSIIMGLTGRPASDPELRASWLVGGKGAADLAANPNTPIDKILTPDAIKNNPAVLQPGMTGAQAIASANAFYTKSAGTSLSFNQDSQPAGPQAPQVEPPPAPTDAYMAAQGFPIANPQAYTGGPGDQLLAIGAGLSGAPSLGKGFAAVGQNMLQLGQQNQQDQLKVAQLNQESRLRAQQFGIEGKRLDQQFGAQQANMALRQAMMNNTITHQGQQLAQADDRLRLAMAPKPTGVTTKTADGTSMQELRDGNGNLTYVPMNGDTTKQQTVDLRANQQSGQPKLIQQAIVDNGKQADEIDDVAEKSYNLLPQIQNFKQVLNSGQTGAGATATDQFKRYIAQKLGMSVGDTTPDSSQIANAMSSQLVNQQISSTMRGLGMRSNVEFNSFKEGMAGLDKNPAALNILLDQMEKGAQYNVGVFNAWHDKAQDEQEKIRRTPGGMSNFEAPLLRQYGSSRGVSPTGQSQPTIGQDSDGTWKPTTAALPGGGQITIQRIN